ncbi:MAG TPA: ATP-binding protein [Noviherbaspirillum sp.]|nr:ATP-binding protein [Noviherbaspirillum sp.]
MTFKLLTVGIENELDVVASRQRARQIAVMCGFSQQEQTRIATAVSELVRNVYNYAHSGKVEFSVEGATAPQVLIISIEDRGPGIADLELILSGRYRSTTGMGLGIIGARRLVDQFDITTVPGNGTTVVIKKLFPIAAPLITPKQVGAMGMALLAESKQDPAMSELQQQNQELLRTLAELKSRQDELLQLTRELEDTNRGVVALYAELDEKADHLRRADEMKTRFLSNMSHEFRTPLSSIRALSKLLLDRVDGDLSEEQERQVRFILKQSESLSDLVNDLLDLAKIEAGKTEVRATKFDIAEMFSALRGMLRPLLISERLDLIFDEPTGLPVMYTDEAKVSQILRNFISNALKFTEAGEVRVAAAPAAGGRAIKFTVSDTGVGIAKEHLDLIFEEFGQVENRLQKHVKGTGLGLPLCKKLALLLGGHIGVNSEPGKGSEFSIEIPVEYQDKNEPRAVELVIPTCEDQRIPVLIVEDDAHTQVLYEKYLASTNFRAVPARSLWEAEHVWASVNPRVVILDIHLGREQSWAWLNKLKADPARKSIPVVLATEIDDKQKGYTLGADAYFIKPVLRNELIFTLQKLANSRENSNHTLGQS